MALQAVIDAHKQQRADAAKEEADAIAGLEESLQRAMQGVNKQAKARAADASQQVDNLDKAVGQLEERVSQRTEEAKTWLLAYNSFCRELQDLGDTDDWLRGIEAEMRTMSLELEYVSQQLAFIHLRSEPA